jgi:hypothetical protein
MFRKAIAYNQAKFSLYRNNAKEEPIEVPKNNIYWKQYLNPNPLQTGEQFKTAVKGIYEIYGYCVVLKSVPDGFEGLSNVRNTYWILPPDMTFIKWNNNYIGANGIKDCIDRIEFGINGTSKITIPTDDVYVYTDLTFSTGSQVLPQSRLLSQKETINNIIVNTESKGVVLANRGAQGIFTDDSKDGVGSTPLGGQYIERLQKDLSKYGLAKDKYKYIITPAQLKFEKITDSPKDLMLSDFMKEDVEQLCVAMGYKYALLFDSDGSTFNNQNQYRKTLYTDNLMPESTNMDRQLNEMFGLDKTDMYFKTTWDHLLVLMEDKKLDADIKRIELENALGMFMNCLITYGRMCDMIGETGNEKWDNRYWFNFSDTERALFMGNKVGTTISNQQNTGGK